MATALFRAPGFDAGFSIPCGGALATVDGPSPETRLAVPSGALLVFTDLGVLVNHQGAFSFTSATACSRLVVKELLEFQSQPVADLAKSLCSCGQSLSPLP